MSQTQLSNISAAVPPAIQESTSKRMAQRLPQDYQSWKLQPPVPNKAGGKSAAITDVDGNPVMLFTDPCRVPFDAIGFQDPEASRVNLCLDGNPDIVNWVQGLDAHMVALLSSRSQVFFGKVLSEAELRATYHSCIREEDKYGSQLLKLKMNKAGRGTVRVWNEAGLARSQPASWQECVVQTRAVLKGIWFQGRNFGLTWEATDVLLKSEGDAVMECPF